MGRTRIVKGTYRKISAKGHSMYSNESIITTAGKEVTETGMKNGVSYSNPLKFVSNEVSVLKCPKCSEAITSKLIRKTLGVKTLSRKQTTIIDSFLPYRNKYKSNFGLDTCLRKAHFIAQIALESANFSTFEEGEEWW